MSEYLLTPEERIAIKKEIAVITNSSIVLEVSLVKAQARKLVRWGDEECTGHGGYQYSLHRRQCSQCWQALKEEIGLEVSNE